MQNRVMSSVKTITKNYWPCFLILLAFIGFVSKSLYNYPVGLMALIGAYTLFRSPRIILKDKILKTFSFVFLCLWLPLLISFPDAVNKAHSAHTVFPYLRFFFAGIFIITELNKNPERIRFIVTGLFYIVLFWCIDASIQFVFGKNLLGFPYQPGHITGMFFPRNTIAHICAILSTFIFLYGYNNFEKKKYLALSIIPLFFVLLLSGRRAAWVMLALSCLGFISYSFYFTNNKKRFLKLFSITAAILVVLLSSTIVFHEPTNSRFKVTLGLFSGNYEKINAATEIAETKKWATHPAPSTSGAPQPRTPRPLRLCGFHSPCARTTPIRPAHESGSAPCFWVGFDAPMHARLTSPTCA